MQSKDILNDEYSRAKEENKKEPKEDKINTFNDNKINNKNKDIIKENTDDDDKIFVVINKNTEKFMNSKNKTDLIQCALEYNSYLIENLIKEKDKLNQLEYNTALDRLYDNLSILTENFELYENKYKLINPKVKDNKDDSIRVYSNSITNIKMELPL